MLLGRAQIVVRDESFVIFAPYEHSSCPRIMDIGRRDLFAPDPHEHGIERQQVR
jgi:hypothetical protein